MAWRRPFIWSCDECATAVEKDGYGMPEGFKRIVVDDPAPFIPPVDPLEPYCRPKISKHICAACFDKATP